MVNYNKSKNITLSVFQNAQRDVLGFFLNWPFFHRFWTIKQGMIFSTCWKFSSWVSFTIDKKLSWTFLNIFFDENNHMDKKNALHYSKINHTQYCTMKTDPIQKNQVFMNIQLHIHFWSKCLKSTILWVQRYFCNPTRWKPTAPAFQYTLTFAQYLFNSWSNMHMGQKDQHGYYVD